MTRAERRVRRGVPLSQDIASALVVVAGVNFMHTASATDAGTASALTSALVFVVYAAGVLALVFGVLLLTRWR